MGSNELALCWKDHHGVLFTVFESLLAKKSLVDCTLAAEGKFLKAHRIVLSACSPYFEALLNQEYDKHPIIFLRDVHFEDLKTLIEFIYSGEIKIPEDRLVEFLSLAEALQIKGLGGPGNELFGKSTLSKKPAKKGARSPVPRKRYRRQSSGSEADSCELIETVDDDDDDNDAKSDRISHSENDKERVVNIMSEPSPQNSNSVNEELSARRVKKEVVNSPSVSQPACLERLTDENVLEKTSEEILGLKTEFEQVTFPETDYADDLQPEDSVSNPPLSTIQDQPSSSHHYSGFVAEPVDPGELALPSPFQVANPEQPAPEGFNATETFTIENALGDNARLQRYTVSSNDDLLAGCSQDSTSTIIYEKLLPKLYEQKLHECALCKQRFSHAGSLKRHYRTHLDERPYQCMTCGKKFRNKSDLQDHMSVHTGMRAYVCRHCNRSFHRRGPLMRHLMAVHGSA